MLSIQELGIVVASMVCILASMVPVGVVTYLWFNRVKLRAKKTMKRLFAEIRSRRDPMGEGRVAGTPLDFRVTVGETVVAVASLYGAAYQGHNGLYLSRTGTASTAISAPVPGGGGPVFTIRHEQAPSASATLLPVESPTELPADFLMEAEEPLLAARLWTPDARAAAGHVRGWRIVSDGQTVSAGSMSAPSGIEELEAIVDLVAAFTVASASRPRGV